MPMKFLEARAGRGGYSFAVWLDTGRLDDAGEPDQNWVARLTWTPSPDDRRPAASIQADAIAYARTWAAGELTKRLMPPPTSLPVEGETF